MTAVTPRTLFRTFAFAEAVSWALLLAAMFAKYVTESEPFGLHEGGVPVAGAIHGGLFVAYVLAAIAASRRFGWSITTTLVALAAGIPPFATAVFEVVADRRGLLGVRGGTTQVSTARE